MQNSGVQILFLVIVAITLPRILVSFRAVCAVNPNRGRRADVRHRASTAAAKRP